MEARGTGTELTMRTLTTEEVMVTIEFRDRFNKREHLPQQMTIERGTCNATGS